MPAANAKWEAEREELMNKVTEKDHAMQTLISEREFYFNKLRDIEVYIQKLNEKNVGTEATKTIETILYAAEQETVLVDDNGMVSVTSKPECGGDSEML